MLLQKYESMQHELNVNILYCLCILFVGECMKKHKNTHTTTNILCRNIKIEKKQDHQITMHNQHTNQLLFTLYKVNANQLLYFLDVDSFLTWFWIFLMLCPHRNC